MTGSAVGTLEAALAHAGRLLDTEPRLAMEQAEEIIKVAGPQPRALVVKAAALGRMGDGDAAIVLLRQALTLKAEMPDAWRLLGDHLRAVGAGAEADAAYAQHIKHSTADPRLMAAALALSENRIPESEALLRAHLRQAPTDVAAIRMLAEVGARLNRYGDAENLLSRCLELAPSFTAARHNYAVALHRNYKPVQALEQIEILQAADARNPSYRNLKAATLVRIGEYKQAIQIYAQVLAEYPSQAKVWMSYGHALKTAGRESESIAAYDRAIALAPGLGEAYWSLANLKTFRFSSAQLLSMRAQLSRAESSEEDRLHFEFALGKALEDAKDYEGSFRHYLAGNQIRRGQVSYDAEQNARHVARSKKLLSADFFARRQDWGAAARDPIFIVGLPRSGSTLVEQILASHSQVEGTMELPDMIGIARGLGGRRAREQGTQYPEVLQSLDAGHAEALGMQYLQQTKIQRKTSRPMFIDKMPNNFAHIGLIHLILPNAKIIDARRHPLGCCLSGFKQHFARGQGFTYDLTEIGRYYRDYVELMAHFDAVLPGAIHRVFYEAMVEDTEAQIRALLAYCDLPFEAVCLEFYRNERAVRTASAQQVRLPIYRQGTQLWHEYHKWLDPLRKALDGIDEVYPQVPRF
jgi:tetratricopeptide (TPR) repeat protein